MKTAHLLLLSITPLVISSSCQLGYLLIESSTTPSLLPILITHGLGGISALCLTLYYRHHNQNPRTLIHPNPSAQYYIKAMLDKTQNNKDLAIFLFNKLFAELPQQLIAIEQALQQKDFTSAEYITHKLHGSVSFCGFNELKQSALILENSLKNKQAKINDFATLKKDITGLLQIANEILAELNHQQK